MHLCAKQDGLSIVSPPPVHPLVFLASRGAMSIRRAKLQNSVSVPIFCDGQVHRLIFGKDGHIACSHHSKDEVNGYRVLKAMDKGAEIPSCVTVMANLSNKRHLYTPSVLANYMQQLALKRKTSPYAIPYGMRDSDLYLALLEGRRDERGLKSRHVGVFLPKLVSAKVNLKKSVGTILNRCQKDMYFNILSADMCHKVIRVYTPRRDNSSRVMVQSNGEIHLAVDAREFDRLVNSFVYATKLFEDQFPKTFALVATRLRSITSGELQYLAFNFKEDDYVFMLGREKGAFSFQFATEREYLGTANKDAGLLKVCLK